MQYEFNISPDYPTPPYGTEGGLDTSVFKEGERILSEQRTGFIEIDSGKKMLVKDGTILDLPEDVILRLEKPLPVSPVLYYTQSSIYYDSYIVDNNDIAYQLDPADARNMTNGIYNESKATGTSGESNFEWIQVDLNGIYDIKGVVVGCDWLGPNGSPWDTSVPGLVGGWGKGYTENCDVQASIDGKNWETIFNTGIFNSPIQIYSVETKARYVRIVATPENLYLAVTEFYPI